MRAPTRSASVRGLTLLEVMVATALLAVLLTLAIQSLIGTQRQASAAGSLQRAVGESRRVAHALARELRALNLTTTDLEPDAPYQATSLSYRAVTGYDAATQKGQLSPARSGGLFRTLALVGDEVQLQVPGATGVTLAKGVEDLRLTLDAPNKLTIKVTVRAADNEGVAVARSSQLTIALPNALSDAE
ncbi:MAG: prepilin-type N-terminal cleavage/methylation domain-containing protein [Planctomycetota bacterium]